MRLFQVDENDNYTEVKSSQRFSNVDDAVIIAKTEAGDGAYALDLQNGTVRLFHVAGGEFKYDPEIGSQLVARENWPSTVYDKEHSDDFESNVSEGGVYYPPDAEGAGQEDPNRPPAGRTDFFGQPQTEASNSYEELATPSTEGAQVPDSAPLTEQRATDAPVAEAPVAEAPVAEAAEKETADEQENEYITVPGAAEGE